MNKPEDSYKQLIKDNTDLASFLRAMNRFDRLFCDVMADSSDFILKLEVRGNKGKLDLCKATCDVFDRPAK